MATDEQSPVKIASPWDGDVLNHNDGQETDQGLTIELQGSAPPDQEVLVAGRPARREGKSFHATVTLSGRENFITAECPAGSHQVQLLYDSNSYKRFRFSVDDNVLFLRDLTHNPPNSLFDHWYLAFWREMHQRFGAKVHINIYHQAPGFILPEMHDRWRGEWQDNAHWLHLSFHALENEPAYIYRHAPARRVARDWEWVMDEIYRFAGPEVTGNTTTVHWAEATREACQALFERGIRNLITLPRVDDEGEPRTSYYLNREQALHLLSRDAWKDTETGLTFVACDEVVNSYPLDQITHVLDKQEESPHTCELIELLIHEQYFREELPNYQPDVKEKVIRALEWVSERGYEPCFWGEGFLGNTKEGA